MPIDVCLPLEVGVLPKPVSLGLNLPLPAVCHTLHLIESVCVYICVCGPVCAQECVCVLKTYDQCGGWMFVCAHLSGLFWLVDVADTTSILHLMQPFVSG